MEGNVAAFVDEHNRLREQVRAVLSFKVLTGAAWEGCDECTDHAGEQTEEFRSCAVFTVGE